MLRDSATYQGWSGIAGRFSCWRGSVKDETKLARHIPRVFDMYEKIEETYGILKLDLSAVLCLTSEVEAAVVAVSIS